MFFQEVLAEARRRGLLSDEHFTVDGTLIEAWASHKSFKPKDQSDSDEGGSNPSVDFRKQRRTNDTHASRTDPDARLYKKSRGAESKLCYMGHLMIDNRHGLATKACVTIASGTAEREAAVQMADKISGNRRVTLAADKGYDTRECVRKLRDRNITPHVAQNDTNRRSAIDRRTTRHPGYQVSQRKRKLVEQMFGWAKTVGLMRKTRPPRHRTRRLDVHLHRRCLQPGQNAQPPGGDVTISGLTAQEIPARPATRASHSHTAAGQLTLIETIQPKMARSSRFSAAC